MDFTIVHQDQQHRKEQEGLDLPLHMLCSESGTSQHTPDMSMQTFIYSLKRFAARKGLPHKIILDNGKFAAKVIRVVISHKGTCLESVSSGSST